MAAVVGAVTVTVAPWVGRTKARSMAGTVGSFFVPAAFGLFVLFLGQTFEVKCFVVGGNTGGV